jgi:DeoR/GlpR family transcriptional regulator of sugar metabolism
MKRALAGRAADTYVLASAEKLGAVSPYKVLDLDAVSAIVTDAAENSLVEELRRTAPGLILTEQSASHLG